MSVPVAFLTMVSVSLLDNPDPNEAETAMLALHAPEGLGLEQLAEPQSEPSVGVAVSQLTSP